MDCIFCKIAKGELPSYKVYEDDKVMAFLDIAPVNPGHTLIISKNHASNLEEIQEDELCQIVRLVKRVGQAVKNSLNVEGYNVNLNNDPIAGQVVPHVHFHVIPRKEGDNLGLWPQKEYKENEAEEIAKKISKELK